MYADHHMHTSFSSDSEAPMEHMVLGAIHRNMPSICFTEHMDFDFPPGEFDFLVDMPAYQEKLMELKKKYEDKIEIYFGMELGLQPHLT
ncbi:PHP domain-containing protein, partial [Blautia pseudococcoides]|nr:PHP domain-containing protein [Blautia pseudococcoides]